MLETCFSVTCISGSMRFYNMMLKVAARLTYEGQIILMPHVNQHMLGPNAAPDTLHMLTLMHREKIRLSQCLFIVNCIIDTNANIVGRTYIGDDTRSEIACAEKLDKRVEYLSVHVESGLGSLFL